jgi:microcystin degradation protein MlrC
MATMHVLSFFFVFILVGFTHADTLECSSFFTVTTYSNTTKASSSASSSSQFIIGMVGSYKVSNMTDKQAMMKFATDYINSRDDILPNTALQL